MMETLCCHCGRTVVASKGIGIRFRRRRLYIPKRTTITIHNWIRKKKTAFAQQLAAILNQILRLPHETRSQMQTTDRYLEPSTRK